MVQSRIVEAGKRAANSPINDTFWPSLGILLAKWQFAVRKLAFLSKQSATLQAAKLYFHATIHRVFKAQNRGSICNMFISSSLQIQ